MLLVFIFNLFLKINKKIFPWSSQYGAAPNHPSDWYSSRHHSPPAFCVGLSRILTIIQIFTCHSLGCGTASWLWERKGFRWLKGRVHQFLKIVFIWPIMQYNFSYKRRKFWHANLDPLNYRKFWTFFCKMKLRLS